MRAFDFPSVTRSQEKQILEPDDQLHALVLAYDGKAPISEHPSSIAIYILKYPMLDAKLKIRKNRGSNKLL